MEKQPAEKVQEQGGVFRDSNNPVNIRQPQDTCTVKQEFWNMGLMHHSKHNIQVSQVNMCIFWLYLSCMFKHWAALLS